MNPSSSSSFSSPPLFVTSPRPTSQSQSSSKRETPSIIPLAYDYQVMAPSSLRPQTGRFSHNIPSSRSTTRQSTNPDVDVDIDEDLPFNSLFGDPVPPPPPDDFLGSTFSTSAFMRSTSVELSSEDDQLLGQTITMEPSRIPQRLFSQVPYTSIMGRRYSNASSASPRNFDVMPSSIPRLKPPDIQVLPNSSGESSTGANNSPNYMLLDPADILRKPSAYEKLDAEDIMELKETYTISDGHSLREFSDATTTRKSSVVGEDMRDEMCTLSPHKEPSAQMSPVPRQHSNESYSSGEWFRTVNMEYPEFNKMPKLRPSSKNVMSIKRDEMPLNSPVAAMINDSNGSSSGGEERLLGATQILDKPSVCLDSLGAPERPPSPSPSCLRSLDETIVLTPREYIKQRRKSIFPTAPSESIDIEEDQEENPPPVIPPKPQMSEEDMVEPQTPIRRERSPVILKDSITTGGDYRVDQAARLHKKTSFTIINEKTSQSSQTQSPRYQRSREHTSPSLIPARTMPKPRHHLQRKSLSSTQLKLPHLMPPVNEMSNEDSPRPSVQFDMSGRYSPSKLPPQKGILHQRESLTSSQDTLPPHQLMKRRPSALPTTMDESSAKAPHMKSCETLPLITDPYRTAIPRLNRSALDLRPETAVFPPGALPRPLRPNPNPTRKQKGLLKVLNHEEALSRIPLKSNWSSMDDLFVERKTKPILSPLHDNKARRRSSSTSPSRRSSTQTTSDRRSSNLSTVTTSDFSFRRPSVTKKSLTPQTPQRRKSIFQLPSPGGRRKSSSGSSITTPAATGRTSRAKIAKPTTLSPIIGTPNKDSSSNQSPTHTIRPLGPGSDSVSDSNSRRDSVSKIPVRSQGDSRSNSRMEAHPESRTGSRSGSPIKDATVTGRTSQIANSRSGSRASVHGPSQPGSRAASRAESRAASRAESRTASRAESRTASRAESRTASRAESRSGSRAASRAESRAAMHGTSQPTSRAASRAESRGPSRSTSRASTRPISLPGSRPTSRMEHAKEIANSRSNSRLSIQSSRRGGSVSPKFGRKTPTTSQVDRRKSVSLSPQRVSARKGVPRRGSISPVGVKGHGRSRSRSKTRSSPEISARSRIPVSHKNGPSSTKSPTRKKAITPTQVRRTASLKTKTKTPSKPPASAKKLPTSVRKQETSVRRTTGAVSKPGPATKRETSNVKKPSTSTGAAAATAAKRESSNASKKSTVGGKPAKRETSSVNLKKKPQDSKTPSTQRKTAKESQADKKATGKAQESVAKAGASSATKPPKADTALMAAKKNGDIQIAATAAAAAAAADVATLSALKRQPSTMSLMRVSSKISLLGKKRSDSNLSKNTLDLIVPEVEASDNRASSPTTQLTADMALAAAADGSAAAGGSLPAAILEKSQKTLENIQKTVAEATDEIQKTINENLTDLKSLEQDMGLTSDSAGSPTPSVTTVVEKKSTGKKGASVSRLGTAENATNGKSPGGVPSQKSPLPPTQPIEASVSVLNADGTQATVSALSNGSSQQVDASAVSAGTAATERVSERAISVMPEVDCESANFQSYDVVGDAEAKVMSAADAGALEMTGKPTSGSTEDYESEAKRRSPDGQGGSQSGSGKGFTTNGTYMFIDECNGRSHMSESPIMLSSNAALLAA